MILVLENPGLNEVDLNKLAKKIGINEDFIWDDIQQTKEAEKIEGIVNVKQKLGEKELEKFPNLKFINVAFTGFDSVDLDYCNKNNIAVYNVPDYSSDSVAELAIGLAINLLRDISKTQNLIKNNEWNHAPGADLRGKKIGIIGTGTIGLKTASLFKAFGCEIIAWSKSQKDSFKKIGVYKNTLNEVMSEADILSIHTPLSKETTGLIPKEAISKMKPSSYIINVARGPIIDEKALIVALRENKIAGAAIDVFSTEPLPTASEWRELNNCILTPHIAYKTNEALKRRAEISLENIKNHFSKTPINKCN